MFTKSLGRRFEGLEDVQLLLGGGVALRRKCRGPLKKGQETPAHGAML